MLLSSPDSPARARTRPTRPVRRVLTVLLTLGVALALAGGPTPEVPRAVADSGSGTRETVVLPIEDGAWTARSKPTTNYHELGYLKLSSSGYRSYLKFDTTPVMHQKIVSAELRVSMRSTMPTGGLLVRSASPAWKGSTLTWRTQPSLGTVLNSTQPRAVKGTVRIPLSQSAARSASTLSSLQLAYSAAKITSVDLTRDSPELVVTVEDVAGPTDRPFGVAAAGSGSKKVFAHYFPPYPVSLDNRDPDEDYYARHYLNPDGEKGKFAAAGGLLRDRPVGRRPASGDWRMADLVQEVKQASDAGLDGFTVNVMGTSGRNWEATVALMKAAEKSGRKFVIVPNVDVNGSIGKEKPSVVAAKLAELYRYRSAYRLADGRYLLSSFKAEGNSVQWWKDVMSTLQSKHQRKIAFTAVLLDASESNMKKFAPISYALSDWGTRNPEGIKTRSNRAAAAKKLGVRWMAPVSFQDVRPAQYVYAESRGSEALRLTWDEAISDRADMVQMITWNDYSETTSFAPSDGHGAGLLDLNAWYLTRYKTGRTPTVKQDAVYVVHRSQPAAAKPVRSHKLAQPTLGSSRTAPVDRVEVVTYLRARSWVRLTVGGSTTSVLTPAGYHSRTVSLRTGRVEASVVRSSTIQTAVRSPYRVVSRPPVQDLQYHVASSRER